jgi:hypothetical protein
MEKNRPNPNNPNVRYFGPGVHGDGLQIIVNKDETMYVAGGAIVYGFINNHVIQVRTHVSLILETNTRIWKFSSPRVNELKTKSCLLGRLEHWWQIGGQLSPKTG